MAWGTVLPEDFPLDGAGRPGSTAVTRLGWSDVWAGEVAGRDAFAQLSACAAISTDIRLGAIVAATTRGPGLLAMGVSTLAALAPGRIRVAIGSSSPQVLAGWNDRPARPAVHPIACGARPSSGRRCAASESRGISDPFSIDGFRLASPPRTPAVSCVIAGLGPRALAMAAETGRRRAAQLDLHSRRCDRSAPASRPPHGWARVVYYAPDADSRERARRLLVAYANVPAYAEHHRRMGRGAALEPVWAAWQAGDRRAALAALPDSVLDELVVSGTPAQCRAHLQAYLDAGLDGIVVHVLTPGAENLAALERLGRVG